MIFSEKQHLPSWRIMVQTSGGQVGKLTQRFLTSVPALRVKPKSVSFTLLKSGANTSTFSALLSGGENTQISDRTLEIQCKNS